MRRASGMEDWYEYLPTKDAPEPSQGVDMGNRKPRATKSSPLYIKVGGTILKKGASCGFYFFNGFSQIDVTGRKRRAVLPVFAI